MCHPHPHPHPHPHTGPWTHTHSHTRPRTNPHPNTLNRATLSHKASCRYPCRPLHDPCGAWGPHPHRPSGLLRLDAHHATRAHLLLLLGELLLQQGLCTVLLGHVGVGGLA